MKKTLYLYIILTFISVHIYANDNSALRFDAVKFIKLVQKDNIKIKDLALETSNLNQTFLSISHTESENIFLSGAKNIILDNFPISIKNNGTIKLQYANPITDANTQWMAGTNNDIQQVKGPEIVSFKGEIEGEKDSRIYLNYFAGKLYGYIRYSDGEQFSIAPNLNNKEVPGEMNLHSVSEMDWSVYPASDFNFLCGAEEYHGNEIENHSIKFDKDNIQSTKLLQANIAIEGEYFYYQLCGSNYNAAAAYIANVMALSARIYEEYLNVTFYLPYVLIWQESTGDPYYNRVYLSQKLWRMPDAWKDRNVDRSLAVLFADLNNQPGTYRIAGISMGGDPYVGSLCSYDQGYCVLGIRGNYKYPTTNYTWDVNVATHEIGHNFSCPHTHSCYWYPNMIDTCITATIPEESDGCIESGNPIPRPGTIMSYCHITNSSHSVVLKFHERELPLARKAAEASNCIKEAQNPYVSLLNPLGDKLLQAGTIETIRWTSAKVYFVNLQYSADGGKSWNYITTNHSASDTLFKWTVPSVSSDSVLILIHSSIDAKVADTSIAYFSIQSPAITILSPLEGDRFGQSESLTINWFKILVNTTRIMFSSDGGNNWNKIAEKLDGNSYLWNIPDIISSDCKMKIIDENDGSVIAISGTFAIGKETGSLIYPNGGEHFCISDTINIQWSSDFVNRFWLQYSIDNGVNWRKVYLAPVESKLKKIIWKIPDKKSNQVLLKISPYTDINNTLDMSDNAFSIDSCMVGVGETKKSDSNMPIKILEIIPNPASNEAVLKVKNNAISNQYIEIILTTETGEIVSKISNTLSLFVGEQLIPVSLANFAQGNYFIIIRSGGHQTSAAIKINR
jgi:hypothetical protein